VRDIDIPKFHKIFSLGPYPHPYTDGVKFGIKAKLMTWSTTPRQISPPTCRLCKKTHNGSPSNQNIGGFAAHMLPIINN